jgi:protein TonB
VSRDLFRQVADPRPPAPVGRLSALPLSMAAHVLVFAALVVIPVIATDVLPAVRSGGMGWMPAVLPPSPPPGPVPAERRLTRSPETDAPTTPLEAPSGISRERLIVADAPVDAPSTDAVGVVPGTGVPGGTGAAFSDAPQPVRPAAPVHASTLVTPPVKIHDVSPIYPEAARLGKVEGVVVIEAVIGPAGDVVDTRVLRPRPLLTEAAVEAVRQWKYTPTLINGRPVPVVMTVTVNFTLR